MMTVRNDQLVKSLAWSSVGMVCSVVATVHYLKWVKANA